MMRSVEFAFLQANAIIASKMAIVTHDGRFAVARRFVAVDEKG